MSAFTLSPASQKFLRREEGMVGHPYWPGGHSGVTLDIGYDLGQVFPETFANDWKPRLPDTDYRRLLMCVGVKGVGAKPLAEMLKMLVIPTVSAEQVFAERTLPRYINEAERDFPGLKDAPESVRCAITSLTFNRGGLPSLSILPEDGSSTDSDRYDNERGIRNAILESNWPKVAEYLLQMGEDGEGTLWPGPAAPHPGLRARRKREAALILTDLKLT